ncbi:nucleotide pyrophosphohydrolase [Leeia aquatica]|uniref:Nucleotide pyrophosphohydrolase n=1 Tax=Leeia aquatica TaxID=2725557 RepID=A0A847RX58_9NEIS|nr:nucleotide pyrophosphohydrolase [Leeia aquatica]NLR74351.1 nucleotide pyrophosphohydrolase [Leeia aquatica]
MTTLQQLISDLERFATERDWQPFHTPKNLAMALSVEAAELVEIFQWEDGQRPFADYDLAQQTATRHEVADILLYLLRFCSVTGIDPLAAAVEKMRLNAEKYPVETAKGRAKQVGNVAD